MDYIYKNQEYWNKFSIERGPWSRPASKEVIQKARLGNVEISVTTTKLIPKSWLPKNWKDIKVLGLASGGGQQMPIIAASGAKVTSYDFSEEQLRRDEEVCQEENLGQLSTGKYDIIINPVSTCFTENVNTVWKECVRVLKEEGILITGQNNPVVYAISEESYKNAELLLTKKIPYSDVKDLSADELKNMDAIEFGHSLTDLIGGQLTAGFQITDFYEDYWGKSFDKSIDKILPQFFATRAIKRK